MLNVLGCIYVYSQHFQQRVDQPGIVACLVLTTVSMCYSQGGGFNTSLFGLLDLYCTLSLVLGVVCVCLVCVGMFGDTVTCYPGRRK